MKTVKFLFVLLFILSTPLQLFGRVTESAENLLRIIHKVNRHWQENNSPQVRSFWDNAAYHTGNMEVYELTGNTPEDQSIEKIAGITGCPAGTVKSHLSRAKDKMASYLKQNGYDGK